MSGVPRTITQSYCTSNRSDHLHEDSSLSTSSMSTMTTLQGFPVEPRVIQTVKKPRFFMNHSYRDFSSIPRVAGDNEIDALPLQQMSFPRKVYHMLSCKKFDDWIVWMPHGRAFRVNVPKKLEEEVLEEYFGHKRYSSFLRQLSNHGFKHISQGTDRNCFYHELMLNGMPHLCKYFASPKDARRLIPDPENELDFYALTEKYPLPKYVESNTTGATHMLNDSVSERKRSRDKRHSNFTEERGVLPLNKRQCRYTIPHTVEVESLPVQQAAQASQQSQGVTETKHSPLAVPSSSTTVSSFQPLSPVSSSSTESTSSEMRELHQAIHSNNQLIALLLLQTQLAQRQQINNNQSAASNGNQLLQQQIIAAFINASGLLQ